MAFEQIEHLVVNRLDFQTDGRIATDVHIDGDITNVDSIQFLTTNGGSDAVGKLAWDVNRETLEFYMDSNVVQEIGQSQFIPIKNNTGSTLTKGQVVYPSGSVGASGLLEVTLALANGDSSSAQTVGIVAESITNGSIGFVQTFGVMENVNTNGLTAGQVVYLSPSVAGGMTSTKPSAPNHMVYVGFCIRSNANTGIIFVKTQNGYELEELHNVKITNPQDGQMLKYQASTGLWINSF